MCCSFQPIPASQSSLQTEVHQPRVIATVKCHSTGMYRRCRRDMFPQKVDANSSRIVPYLEGTCGRYLGAFLELQTVSCKDFAFLHVRSKVIVRLLLRPCSLPCRVCMANTFMHPPPSYQTISSQYQDQAQSTSCWLYYLHHFFRQRQTPQQDTRRHSRAMV